jgi:hypothetical protein
MCGSMGSYYHWKEYLEVFGTYTAITVNDFIDMRVRGFEGEFDSLHAPHLNEHADEIMKYGFDFYEEYKASQLYPSSREYYETYGMITEIVKRPIPPAFDVSKYEPVNPDLWGFIPDKGWVQSLEHFAECFLNGSKPQNADGKAGALSTNIALSLLKSLDTGQAINL